MRLGFLLFAACLVTAVAPVMAAEQGVIIINPDGTVSESNDPMAQHNAAKAAVIKSEKISPPEPEGPVKDVIKPDAEPKPSAVKAPAKPPVLKTVKQKPIPAKIVKPKKEPVAKAVPLKAAPVATAEAPKIKWNKPPKNKPKPVAIKPVAATAEPVLKQAPSTARVPPTLPAQPPTAINRDDALRAAIAVAPPFTRSTVLPGNYKGRPVYEVTLQTENGEQSILVDSMTGDIIKTK